MQNSENYQENWIKNINSSGALISYLYRTNLNFLSKKLKPFNLSGGQFPFLMSLYHDGTVNQDSLAKAKGYDKTTTARALKKLEDQEYVVREKDQEDGRVKLVRVSKKGIKIQPHMKNLSEEWTEILFRNFSDDEIQKAMEIIKKMSLNVSSYMEGEENK
ncbi:MarR family transcriptional regulator [Methanoplanus sp. FWC-SCC4]|uniref:MarR family transcriptional regulator n=2 Tax=Methanochimaera problematica TaxID=2609417 RepID=A0AA97FAP5_9EURY|nr:MarR family transcriptional regulator [Methanoplanus sp. FWC-SCC4]WOF15432.1 MarR family transcriptional regulator [Methanoplanus sp. FWC-SCC4]